MSDRERRELEYLRKEYDGKRRFKCAMSRGLFMSLVSYWVSNWIIGFDTTLERSITLVFALILFGLGILSNYYGRFRTESYSIYIKQREETETE